MHPLYYKIETELLPIIEKPLRYSGSDHNMVKKEHQNRFSVLLTFPDIYDIGMSYQGYQILYHVINKRDDLVCERAYLPTKEGFAQFKEFGIPLFGLESREAANEFDVIGITIAYELNYTNILGLLDLSQVPFCSKDRGDDCPIIVGGGANALNPEPVADFFDLIVLGDGEEKFLEVIDLLKATKGENRAQRLAKAADLGGVYVPSHFMPNYQDGRYSGISAQKKSVVFKNVVNLKAENFPNKPLVPLNEIAQDRLSIEIMRGCSRGCRFCQAGYLYRPVRERSVEDILAQVDTALKNSGHTEMTLLSLSSSDYSAINCLTANLFDRYANNNIDISFPSMRAESFTKEVAQIAQIGKKGSFTFAPEAGSKKMRAVINKQVDLEQICRVLDIILPLGWKGLKLYYMIGLPFESEDDILEMANMINEIARYCKPYGHIKIHVSISPFNPKPHTPFQWACQDTFQQLMNKVYILKDNMRFKNVRLDWRNPEISVLEAIFARGDRRLAPAIIEAYRQGAMLEAWREHFDYKLWINIFNEMGINYQEFVEGKEVTAPLPWDHLDSGVSKEFFISEWNKSKEEAYSQFCREKCSLCGIEKNYNCRNLLLNSTDSADFSHLLEKLLAPKPEPLPLHLRPRGPKFRIKFKRELSTRFISHRDLLRFLERGISREKIAIAYSEGFHPLPLFSFTHPLSYGYMSDCEYVDFVMMPDYKGDLFKELSRLFTDGFELISVREVERSIPALMKSVNYYEYKVDLNLLSLAEIDKAVDYFKNTENIPYSKGNKSGQSREVNIKEFALGIEADGTVVTLKTRFVNEQTVRTADLLKVIFGLDENQLNKLLIKRTFAGILTENGVVEP